jgi:hypothetical protein
VRDARDFMEKTTGMAFIMMLCGIMAATVAGVVIRVVELTGRSSGVSSAKSERPRRSTETRAAA